MLKNRAKIRRHPKNCQTFYRLSLHNRAKVGQCQIICRTFYRTAFNTAAATSFAVFQGQNSVKYGIQYGGYRISCRTLGSKQRKIRHSIRRLPHQLP
jgi:hypothetical protein